MSIAAKLKRLRNEKGYSQENVAEAAGITHATYNKIESDKCQSLNFYLLEKIAGVLEVPLLELLPKCHQAFYHEKITLLEKENQELKLIIQLLLSEIEKLNLGIDSGTESV